MNEAILKWLSFGTIGLVVCGSLWLAGTVQQDAGGRVIVGASSASTPHRRDIHLAASPAERAASAVAVRAAFLVE